VVGRCLTFAHRAPNPDYARMVQLQTLVLAEEATQPNPDSHSAPVICIQF